MKKFIILSILVLSFLTIANAANSYAYYKDLDMSNVMVVAGGDCGFLFIPSTIIPSWSDVPNFTVNMDLSGAFLTYAPLSSSYVVAYIPSNQIFAGLLAAKTNSGKLKFLTIQGANASKSMCDLPGTTWYVKSAIQ